MTTEQPRHRHLVQIIIVFIVIMLVGYFISAPVRREREIARRNQCLNHLRQLWSASMMYAQDYDGWMPIYTNNNRVVAKVQSKWDFYGFPSPERLRASLQPYIKDGSVWYCPSDKRAGKQTGGRSAHADHQYSSYVYRFLKPGMLRSDGVVSDVAKRMSSQLINSHRYPLILEDDCVINFLGTRRLRGSHLGQGNVIFLDGHTSNIQYD